MSESCGSNNFPHAEGKKTNRKRTRQEVEDPSEALSTTQHYMTSQQPFKVSKRNKNIVGSSGGIMSGSLEVNPDVPDCADVEPSHRLQVMNPEAQMLFASRVNTPNLDHPNVPYILDVAVKAGARESVVFFTVLEGRYLAEQLMKLYSIEVLGDEVRNILNLFHTKFQDYCNLMQRGVKGLKFNYETGMVGRQIDNEDPKLKNIEQLHMHVILYFPSLKIIFNKIWQKYLKSKQKREKNNSTRTLRGTSSSGKRMSTSDDTSGSMKKSKPKLSFTTVMNDYDGLSPELKPLNDRIDRLYNTASIVTMDIFNKILLKYFSNNKSLRDDFMLYDDDTFRKEILKLKNTL